MYDDICKLIATKFSKDLATWIIGEPVELTVLEPTELQVDPIRADSVIFLQSQDLILHIEFQTVPKKDVPFRMADYRLRLHRCFPNKRIYQVVIYLRKTTSELVRINTFNLPQMQHRFNVIRLWEIPTEQLLSSPGLLPFAVLSNTDNRTNVLEQVGSLILEIEDESDKQDISTTTAIIAGLVLDKITIKRVLRQDIMKESVIYQDIKSEGKAEGKAEGKLEGIAEGIELGRQQEANLVLRLLNRRIGEIPQELTEQIHNLSVEGLENLGVALLDFETQTDLVNWLEL